MIVPSPGTGETIDLVFRYGSEWNCFSLVNYGRTGFQTVPDGGNTVKQFQSSSRPCSSGFRPSPATGSKRCVGGRWRVPRTSSMPSFLFPLYSFSLLSSLPRPPPSAIFVSTETETLNYETKSTPRRPGNPTGTGRWSGASAQFYGPQRRRRTASLENGELGETLAALVLKTGHLGIDAIMTRFVGHYSQ